MNRRDFIKKSTMGTCAFVIGQGLVFSSCKKEKPDGRKEPPTNSYFIDDRCIGCGDCVEKFKCPIGAIHKREYRYYIDRDNCIDCGECAKICPVGAIRSE